MTDRFTCMEVAKAAGLTAGRKNGQEQLYRCPRHGNLPLPIGSCDLVPLASQERLPVLACASTLHINICEVRTPRTGHEATGRRSVRECSETL